MTANRAGPHAGHIFGTAAILILPVAIFAPKGLAVLFILAAVAVFARSLADGTAGPRRIADSVKWLLCLLSLSLASALWAPVPGETLATLAALSLTFLGGLILFFAARGLTAGERRVAEAAILWGGFAGFALLGFELQSEAKLTLTLRELFGKDDSTLGDPVSLFNTSVTPGQ